MNDTPRQNPGYRLIKLYNGDTIMPKDRYEINETVYIHMGGPGNKLQKGTIINIFEHLDQILYIIEVVTHIDPTYEVRDWSTISETPEGPINFVIDMVH